MIKIVTALGNPCLNTELNKYDDFEIIGKDIQYKDGIISFEEVINSIIKLNRKIKIIAVLKEKNIEIEEYLLKNRSI